MPKVFRYIIKANDKEQLAHCLDCGKIIADALIERGAVTSIIDLKNGETIYGNNFTPRYTKSKR